MFWIPFGGWLIFCGLLIAGFIPQISTDLKVVGGTLMVVFGLWIVSGHAYAATLEHNSKAKEAKKE